MAKEDLVYARKQLYFVSFLYIGHLIIGYTIGWTAPVVPKLQDIEQTPLNRTISLKEASWIGSSFNVGVIIGPYWSAHLANNIGRKKCLLLGGSISAIGYIVLLFGKDVIALIAGRFVVGFGLGTVSIINLVYIGEIVSTKIRGTMLTLTGVFHALGNLAVYTIGQYTSYAVIAYVYLALSVVYLLGVLYIPESPLYHIIKGNEDKAVSILRRLGRGQNIKEEMKSIATTFTVSTKLKECWKEIFTIKCNRKAFIITVSIYVFQECCGLLAVAYFLTTIFQKSNSVPSNVGTIIVGLTQFVAALVAPTTVDKLGRKTLLMISTAGISFCMTILGVYFFLDSIHHPLIPSMGWVPLAALMLCYSSFGIGLNIIPNTLLGEMFRPNVRSTGATLSMTMGWTASFISVLSFGYIAESAGCHVLFWIFAIINVFAFAFVSFFVPETKGLTLTEIEDLLSK